MKITEKIRTKILLHLPKGYAAEIANSCGVHVNTVYRVLHHEHSNDEVAEALIMLANKIKSEKSTKHKRLRNIVSQL